MQTRFSSLPANLYSADDGHFPVLKGKAGEIKHLPPALLECFVRYMNRDSKQHRQIKLMLELIVKIESILNEHASVFIFPDHVVSDFQKSCFAFVQLNTDLANHYHSEGKLLFHHTIKFHYVLHIALTASYQNPRMGWCYSGEDMMHKMKVLVQGSNRGTSPEVLVSKALRKYALGIGLSMHRFALLR